MPRPRSARLASLVSHDNQFTDAAARIQLRLGWRPAPSPSGDPAAAYKAARRTLRER
jgi:hypothetical protein